MKIRSLIWAILPGLAASAGVRTFSTSSKCCIVNGKPLCPGTTLDLEKEFGVTQFVTITAGFPPRSRRLATWTPKWEQTVYLPPRGPLVVSFDYDNFFLGDDECVYVHLDLNPWLFVRCLNQRYVGNPIPNPWATLAYGPDGPIDYKDPQHIDNPNDPMNGLGRSNEEYDPDKLIPSNNQEDATFTPFKDFLNLLDGGPNYKLFDNQKAPPLTYPPPIKHGDPQFPNSAIDGSEKTAFAHTHGNDNSLFSNSIANGDTSSFDNAFDGTDPSTVATTLDPSILANNPGGAFDLASQADLGAFDLNYDTASASDGSSDLWSSSTLAGSPNNQDMFATGPDSNSDGTSLSGDLRLLDASGPASNDLFSKRSRKAAREFRF